MAVAFVALASSPLRVRSQLSVVVFCSDDAYAVDGAAWEELAPGLVTVRQRDGEVARRRPAGPPRGRPLLRRSVSRAHRRLPAAAARRTEPALVPHVQRRHGPPVFQSFVDRGVRLTTSAGSSARRSPTPWCCTCCRCAATSAAYDADQRAHRWQPVDNVDLEGRLVGIIGMGSIGSEVARLVQQFGMQAIGTRRSPTGREPCEIWSPQRLPELLALVDDLVLCAPLSDETRQMIGERELATMRPGGHLVNVGRGELDRRAGAGCRVARRPARRRQPRRVHHRAVAGRQPAVGHAQRDDHAARRRGDAPDPSAGRRGVHDNLVRYAGGEPLRNEGRRAAPLIRRRRRPPRPVANPDEPSLTSPSPSPNRAASSSWGFRRARTRSTAPSVAPVAVCWSVKGGSGTTVVATTLALLSAQRRPTLLVDLAGDCPVALGASEPPGPGVAEWLRSANADADALGPARRTRRGAPRPDPPWRRGDLDRRALGGPRRGAAASCPGRRRRRDGRATGCARRPAPCSRCWSSARASSRLRRATQATRARPASSWCSEPGRALRTRDVEHALGVGVVAEVDVDPAVARAVDAGLLQARLPRPLAPAARCGVTASDPSVRFATAGATVRSRSPSGRRAERAGAAGWRIRSVTEVLVNGGHEVWVERAGVLSRVGTMRRAGRARRRRADARADRTTARSGEPHRSTPGWPTARGSARSSRPSRSTVPPWPSGASPCARSRCRRSPPPTWSSCSTGSSSGGATSSSAVPRRAARPRCSTRSPGGSPRASG